MRTLLIVALMVTACTDGDVPVEEACAEQAEVFCATPCLAGWDNCLIDFENGCLRVAQNDAVSQEDHAACLEQIDDPELVCRYPISIPSVCFL